MKIAKTSGLVLAIVLVGVAAWVFTHSSPDTVPTQTTQTAASTPGAALAEVRLPATLSAEAASGKTYYEAVCASCHGANAAGQDGVAPPLVHKIYEPAHHGDAAFLAAVRNGARQHHWSFGPMMPLEQKLTDGEIGAIIRYVRELQRENGIM